MINPERIRKGDWVFAGDETPTWCEVEKEPWEVPHSHNPDMGSSWSLGLWICDQDTWERKWYVPASLGAVRILRRDGVELWNAANDPVQLSMFDENAISAP